ncbi:hypothetical protein SLS58_002218 [Diplodia intermedia]|uniref:DUF7918 domain-containing protein n=1 Tax=Diplodia intermedia TaxID=856260 RepID=A0ABR3TZY4_9PEZI
MAIISDIPGLRVEVRVHGQPLDEFPSEDEPDTSDTATRYIEATSGVEFTVRITYDEALDPRYKSFDIQSRLELDGKLADRSNTQRKDWIRKERKEVNYYGSRSFENGKWYFRTMAFSQVNIVDENDQILRSDAEIQAFRSLGEIMITFRRNKVSSRSRTTPIRPRADNSKIIDSIPEKKLKGRAISHQVKFGEARPLERSSTTSTYLEYMDDGPFATFVFRYRSKDALKAECVISRTVTPEPLENRPVESLTAEEARELVRRLKDQQGARQSPPPENKQEVKEEIKEEFDQGKRPSDAIVVDLGSEDSDVEITGVRTRKRLRTSGPVEVIDLSDD